MERVLGQRATVPCPHLCLHRSLTQVRLELLKGPQPRSGFMRAPGSGQEQWGLLREAGEVSAPRPGKPERPRYSQAGARGGLWTRARTQQAPRGGWRGLGPVAPRSRLSEEGSLCCLSADQRGLSAQGSLPTATLPHSLLSRLPAVFALTMLLQPPRPSRPSLVPLSGAFPVPVTLGA